MIVEDEAEVRKSLVRLVKKSEIEIGEIVECCNGQEALCILKKKTVDVVFTDIHMPEMDGCELAEQIAGMEQEGRSKAPRVVVVSGFENFQCAIEMLKYGARDYILKPASEEAVRDVLERMELEIRREEKQRMEIRMIYRQHMRNLLKNQDNESQEVWEIMASIISEQIGSDTPYRLVLTNPAEMSYPQKPRFSLDRVNGDLYLILEKDLDSWICADAEGFSLGISGPHISICDVPVAYEEALNARKASFILNSSREEYGCHQWQTLPELDGEIEKFLQQFPSNKLDVTRKRFQSLCFEARHERLSPVQLVDLMEKIVTRLNEDYQNIYSSRNGNQDCPHPLDYISVDQYLENFDVWLTACHKALLEEENGLRRNDKIRQAVEYINENYQKDLNLAMVSNHVSMNYSMFSNAFKKYTGVNFVNYLKNIRIAEAKILLEETNKKVAEVGLAVGYGNDKHFMKTFKAICGVSPSEYRRNLDLMQNKKEEKQ